MDANVEKLLILQQLDLEIDGIKRNLADYSSKLEKLTAEATEKSASLENAKEQLRQIEVERRDFEGTLQLEEQRAAKSKTRLKTLKTQYEFQALQREIDATKRANEELEETILKKMEEIETLKKAMEDFQTSFEACEKVRSTYDEEVTAKSSELNEQLTQKEADAKAALDAVDPTVLAKYRFIRQRRPGTALVAVLGGACQGCFMSVPHQQVNEMLSRQTSDVCPNCQRMIYVPDPEPAAE